MRSEALATQDASSSDERARRRVQRAKNIIVVRWRNYQRWKERQQTHSSLHSMASLFAPSLTASTVCRPLCRYALSRQPVPQFPCFSITESLYAPATARATGFVTPCEKPRTHLGSRQRIWFTRGVLSSGKRKKSCRWHGTVVRASLFGVGAPEVLVIAVVSLLVFGPKGLAEVARTLGKSLRAFQPTIRELQEVSRDFKQTLEKEIGLDEFRSLNSQVSRSISTMSEQPQNSIKSSPSPELRAYSTEDHNKLTEEQAKVQGLIPEQQQQATTTAWGGSPPTKVNGEIINDAASRQDKSQDGHAASDRS